jgi:hypothetical protein
LPTRFAHHNGLVKHGGGNKREKIDAYFERHERLGFSVLLQSKEIQFMEQIEALDFTMGATGAEVIAVGEGQLIEMHRLAYGKRPPWNDAGGSEQGKRLATPAEALLDLLAARRDSLFAARRTLRDLVGDFRARLLESTIHAARMRVSMDLPDLNRLPTDSNELSQLMTRSLLVRKGALLQDLDASDAEIKDWIERLGDPDHWEQEAKARHELFADAMPQEGTQERDVLDLIDARVEGGAPEIHLLATGDILKSGYLQERWTFE